MFKCKPLCQADCCGIVIFDIQLWELFQHLKQVDIKEIVQESKKVLIITHDFYCIFLNRESRQCAIYQNRPSVCRLYGLVEDLQCPYIKPNGNIRSEANSKHIQRLINHQVDRAIEKFK